MDLAAGKIAWTDDRCKASSPNWASCSRYVTANHAAIDWQDAAALLVQGKAANYVMGNFAVGIFKEGGMTNDNLGFMAFPEITPGIPRAEEAPTDTIHIPAGAKNVDDAKTFLAYVASADAQTKLNAALGQLPINKNSTVRRRSVHAGRVRDAVATPMRWRSSSTVTPRPKWRRPAWKASSSSWCSRRAGRDPGAAGAGSRPGLQVRLPAGASSGAPVTCAPGRPPRGFRTSGDRPAARGPRCRLLESEPAPPCTLAVPGPRPDDVRDLCDHPDLPMHVDQLLRLGRPG